MRRHFGSQQPSPGAAYVQGDRFDDREAKPLNIGRRLLLAFGNSDGDLPMLRYAKSGRGARLALLGTDPLPLLMAKPKLGLPDPDGLAGSQTRGGVENYAVVRR